jgi:hypothetical protein
MEIVSPLIFKKLDFKKFDKVGFSPNDGLIYFEENANKIIQFNDDNIKIFNTHASNMKKNVHLKLSK